MNVKSMFTGLFSNSGPRCLLVLLFFSLLNTSFTEHPDRELMSKQANILIRKIGHHLLWQAGDSTTRVLPVKEMKTGTFLLQFENKFVFHPDSMMALTKRLLTKADFPSGFTLTVHDCASQSIVYGFQVNTTLQDILSCKGRIHPPGCYTIEFTFPDFYKTGNQQNPASDLTDGRVAGSNDFALPSTEETTADRRVDSAGKISSEGSDQRIDESAIKTPGGTPWNLLSAGVLVLLIIGFLIGRFGKRGPTTAVANQAKPIQHDQISESPRLPELPALGAYLFDAKGSRLLLGEEVIGLTDKECKVLELLHNNFGELIERETLLQEVWIKEGVITGRSLDMFVSKLRKKLSGDPGLRITNVHGKGYRLEEYHLTAG